MTAEGVAFFLFIHTRMHRNGSWRRTFYPVSLSAVRAKRLVASSLVPSAQAFPDELMRTKENDIGKDKGKSSLPPYSSPADAMKGGVGRNSGSSSPAPSNSASTLRSASRSRRSRSSHSDTSLPTWVSSPTGCTILPTSVVVRKSSIA